MKANELFDGIGRGQFHKPGALRCLRLFKVDKDFLKLLQDEVRSFMASQPPSHVVDGDHVTNWTKPYGKALQWSLKNRSGKTNDHSSDHDNDYRGKKFGLADEFPRIAQVVDQWPEATNFRLNSMWPQSGLSPHEEDVCFKHQGKGVCKVRLHLPVIADRHSLQLLDGEKFNFKAGEVYYFNNGCVHAAENRSETDQRVHLVWDQWLSESVAEQFLGEVDRPAWLWRTSARKVAVKERVHVATYEIEEAPPGIRWTWEEWQDAEKAFHPGFS